MSRREEIGLVTAGILAGIAVSGPAAQAAAGLMANPSKPSLLEDIRLFLEHADEKELDSFQTVEKNAGRVEKRMIAVS